VIWLGTIDMIVIKEAKMKRKWCFKTMYKVYIFFL